MGDKARGAKTRPEFPNAGGPRRFPEKHGKCMAVIHPSRRLVGPLTDGDSVENSVRLSWILAMTSAAPRPSASNFPLLQSVPPPPPGTLTLT